MPLVLLISSGTNKGGESKYPGGEVGAFRRVGMPTWIVFSSIFFLGLHWSGALPQYADESGGLLKVS
jgi:hypothetical protein